MSAIRDDPKLVGVLDQVHACIYDSVASHSRQVRRAAEIIDAAASAIYALVDLSNRSPGLKPYGVIRLYPTMDEAEVLRLFGEIRARAGLHHKKNTP